MTDQASAHIARGEFMQSLHTAVNTYAQLWDESHLDPKHPQPTTRAAWLADFKTWLDTQAAQDKQAQHQAHDKQHP